MAFLGNDAVNRVNLHYGIQAIAQSGGGVFFIAFLIKTGLSVPDTLLTMAAIMAGRFALRPAILPLARRWGMKPLLIVGVLVIAAQYPAVAEVHGVGPALVLLCVIAAVGDVLYWPAYHAYFAAIGDSEHRGHQVSAREAIVSVVSIAAPLAGGLALVTLGPRPMFALVGLVQALSVLPLVGAPNVAVTAEAPGAFAAARLGAILYAIDGWLSACFQATWQIALFISLGRNITGYGGAMALAALVGAVGGLLIGRHIDLGGGRRAVTIAYTGATALALVSAASFGSPWLAVGANALGAIVGSLTIPAVGTATYNLAKVSPCPLRFHIATEGGCDLGHIAGCLVVAGLASAGVSLSVGLLMALPAILAAALLLRRYYAEDAPAPAISAPATPGVRGHE